MKLQNIKVSQCYESETNPRGKDFEGPAFAELVASVKEKGVLVPVLARPRVKGAKEFEIVAGNRRFRAAQKAGLAEIPAQVDDMTDEAAREAQIIENLQRADIHPMDEGWAYRKLIEENNLDVKTIALRVAKSESYVRARLFLTNLIASAEKSFRAGKILDGHAVLIAKLSPNGQKEAMKHIAEEVSYLDEGYDIPAISELKEWIERQFYQPLKFQPWLKDEKALAAVGACKECPPASGALFGDMKPGQCIDAKCWGRKMAAYIKFKKSQAPDLSLVTESYGKSETDALSHSDYAVIEGKKDRCEFVHQAIIADGERVGTTLAICFSHDCEKHHNEKKDYAPDAKEQAKRKKEREKQVAARAKFDAEIVNGLEKIKWPLSEKHLDALLELTLRHNGTSYQMPIVKRHGLEAVKKKLTYGMSRDYEAPLRKFVIEGGKDAKLRLIFEFLLPGWNPYGSNTNKEVKSL